MSPRLIKDAPLAEIVRKRFGPHRGLFGDGLIQNSLKAIAAAVQTNPPFIEFDVVIVDGKLKTSHPPQEPLDDLADVLSLFEETDTYPKIDIKPPDSLHAFIEVIDCVINLIRQKRIAFSLLNLGKGSLTIKDFKIAESHLALRINGDSAIRLNIDPKRYGVMGQTLDARMQRYAMSFGDVLFSISPEIHQRNKEKIAEFAQKCNIGVVAFWLISWPDVPNPEITEDTIRNTLELEEQYSVTVFFDINPAHIVPNKK